jgi:hypothetical protein
MLARRYVKTRITAIFGQVLDASGPEPAFGGGRYALQNGNNQYFPLIFTCSRQNDDEDTLRSQQHQVSELGTV